MRWDKSRLDSVDKALDVLMLLKGKSWICRGQAKLWGDLSPLIDRCLKGRSRADKLQIERRSIEIFRSNARFLYPGEEEALKDDIAALMVLRHYGIPTRLLDWTKSPFVAAYFACADYLGEAAEIWAFDEQRYVQFGKKQWRRWPETTLDRSGYADKFQAGLTAFRKRAPNWFICGYYPQGFPRHNVQQSVYSLTAYFGVDHAIAIAKLLKKPAAHHRYIVPAKVKVPLLEALCKRYKISKGTLFPDTAGAVDAVRVACFPKAPQKDGIPFDRSLTEIT